ncbi:MAG TPA: 2'-5' RNA ligase family protein [Vicinamibacteria bacterium]
MSPAEETAQGLFLWLAPGEPEGAALARLLLALARRLGTPPFDPHVTLLGPVAAPPDEALARCAELARRLAPLALPLRDVRGEDDYFRALYAAVEPTPALLAAREAARALLPAPDAPFRPHLSLAYGRLEDTAQVALSIELRPQLPSPVRARHLELIRTDGPVRAWRRLGRFDLAAMPS